MDQALQMGDRPHPLGVIDTPLSGQGPVAPLDSAWKAIDSGNAARPEGRPSAAYGSPAFLAGLPNRPSREGDWGGFLSGIMSDLRQVTVFAAILTNVT